MEFTRRPLELFAGKNLRKAPLLTNPFGSVNGHRKRRARLRFWIFCGNRNRKAQRMFDLFIYFAISDQHIILSQPESRMLTGSPSLQALALGGLHDLTLIFGHPLGVVRKFGKASFQPLEFTLLVVAVCYLRRVGDLRSLWRDIDQ